MWSPELVVDEELARSLVGDRLPHLRDAPMRLLGEGWDSTVWLARRRVGVPLPPPRGRGAGVPCASSRRCRGWRRSCPCPCRWRCISGSRTTASAGRGPASGSCPAVSWPRPPRRRPPARGTAATLGRFLRALHDIDPRAVDRRTARSLPVDPERRADMPFRVGRTGSSWPALDAARAVAGAGRAQRRCSSGRGGCPTRRAGDLPRRPAPAPSARLGRRRARRA